MRWTVALVVLLALIVGGVWFWPGARRAAETSSAGEEAEVVGEEVIPDSPPRRAGRVAARPDRGWLTAARQLMGEVVESRCGPYLLLSDAAAPSFYETCERIGAGIESVYRERFGLEPVGRPDGAILLFGERRDFRRFATESAGLAAGYAGFSRAGRGVVALHSESQLSVFAATLAHELTHLVNRRALGSSLPPWLAEGLADAIGDAADEAGLGALGGRRGVEAQAARLAEAYSAGRVGGLERLAGLTRGHFDRGVVSYDYEQSALLVRMLLEEPDLAPGFRRFLDELAAGTPYRSDLLPLRIGMSWRQLSRRLEREVGTGR